MEIEHLTLNDAGRYTCLAESSAGHAEKHFDVDISGLFDWFEKFFWLKFFTDFILVPPAFNDSLSHVKIQALINSTSLLLCSTYGVPKPIISWSYNKNLLPKYDLEELIIERVQVKWIFLLLS